MILRISKMAVVCLALLFATGSAQPYSWPAWSVETATGSQFNSRELEGKVVLVSIWGSWCPNCRKQLPVLDSLQTSMPDGEVQVVAFSLDKSEQTHQRFVQENRISVPSVYARNGDGLEVVRLLQEGAGVLEAVPTLLIYDKRGRLAHRMVGFFNRKQLEHLIAPLIREKL